jgi:hypothetical protein
MLKKGFRLMAELPVSAETFKQLTKVAQEKESTAEALAEQVIRQFLEVETERKMAQEVEAFQVMHAQLLAQYPNHYVAIHQGQLVDHDPDQLALFLRIDERFADEVVLIRQVLPEVDPIYTIHSTRFEHDR